MKVAIIDIGSNTARLLVASVDAAGGVTELDRARSYLRLGDDVHERGRIGDAKLRRLREVTKGFARRARQAGVERLQTIVTAPGRQAANRDDLVRALTKATNAPVIVLTGDEEGRLAWEGAVACLEPPPGVAAVVDLGGGSCELAVGRPALGASWIRSVDMGALRVTRSYLGGDPPSEERIDDARRRIRELAKVFDPPSPDVALAVGGTARAIGRIVGRRLEDVSLENLAHRLSSLPAESVAGPYGITPERAHTLLGGTLVLTEVARRLDCALEVGRSGLREGAALALARHAAAVA